MKILIVEDEKKLAQYLCQGLTQEGYQANAVHNGIDGLHEVTTMPYDLLILDGNLPGIDGMGVLAALRQTHQLPVLMLTARNSVEDRVRGLTAGADDYLAKPFVFSELLARVQALLRRSNPSRQQSSTTEYVVADLRLDFVKRKAFRQDKRLDLSSKEFLLLTVLMQRSGEIISRTELAQQVWDMNFDSDTNVVEVAVRRLRLKVDEGFESALIHNVRGMGYVLEPRIAQSAKATPHA
ncbi:heavy metal response regulator transcription factor [Variovorax sp. PCZ-1]|uniref:heavy metal response regulator transcription factor n=1 Tax=Variovorax sp. PCZ-1 TaxID=2835533 RepID=UPI001BCEA7F5|nr:heavy metal response regulator transcription factor [Variovorax sp. PCZ-1]MBS7809264.1 heavy metal response regulator transcription factor [Variovorax sp. PCZ-1]